MKERKAHASKARRDERRLHGDVAVHWQLSGPAPVGRPWSVPIAVSDIPQTGRRVELTADAATRVAVAEAVGIAALSRLDAVFDLMPLPDQGARVAGEVSATVEQTCVVTLDPMESQVEEQLDLVFQPAGDRQLDTAEAVTALDVADPPEVLVGGVIDLGAVATEFLMLGIDPYPRKPDATFEAPAADDPAAHPFAALAALKKGPGSRNP